MIRDSVNKSGMWKFHLANYFFFVFHTLLILFNLAGWLVPRWRRGHLIALLLTVFSWTILGYWKGWGYCPLTEWHYQVLEKLGHSDLPASYVGFLWEQMTGIRFSSHRIDLLTLSFTLLALIASLWVNFWREKKPTPD